jgi:predicted nucleotidyltransferase
MELAELIQEKREDILHIAARHGASNVRVFGSVARGEAGPDSDVDFLIELEPTRSLMDISSMVADLQELLGRSVDLAEPEGLHRLVRERVLREAIYL